MFERGRCLKVPQPDRLCVCCNKLEDEFHVICECPRYSSIRRLYIKPYYVRKSSMFKLNKNKKNKNKNTFISE